MSKQLREVPSRLVGAPPRSGIWVILTENPLILMEQKFQSWKTMALDAGIGDLLMA